MRILLVFLFLFPATLWAEAAPPTITATGEGRVAVAPDMATISVGVTTQQKTAAATLAENNKATAAVLERLKADGVAPRDLQTSGLSLSPLWDRQISQSSQNSPPKISGYVASNTIVVRLRDLVKLGEILDSTVGQGANQFNGLSFGLQDPKPSEDAARRAAVADAMARAHLYASAAGVRLGRILSISEPSSRAVPEMAMARMAASDGVPVAEGELSISAQVTIVFAIAAH